MSIAELPRLTPRQEVSDMGFSGIARMVQLANEAGGELIRLEMGDVDADAPSPILRELVRAFEEGQTNYPAFRGDPELLALLVRELEAEMGHPVDYSDLLVTSGGSMGIWLSLNALLGPGDEVLLPEPVWPHLASMVSLANAIPVRVGMDAATGFRLDIDRLASRLTERTRMILVNTPSNPTGAVMTEGEVSALVEFAATHGLAILSDEEYSGFCYGDRTLVSPRSRYLGTLVVRSFSKSLAISGLRLGYLYGPRSWLDQISKVALYSTMYCSSLAQRAVARAYEDCRPFTRELRTEFEARMRLAVEMLNASSRIRCAPCEGAVYVWPDFRDACEDDWDLAERLLREAGVVVVPGSCFGESGRGFLRLSLACPRDVLAQGLSKIVEYVERRNAR